MLALFPRRFVSCLIGVAACGRRSDDFYHASEHNSILQWAARVHSIYPQDSLCLLLNHREGDGVDSPSALHLPTLLCLPALLPSSSLPLAASPLGLLLLVGPSSLSLFQPLARTASPLPFPASSTVPSSPLSPPPRPPPRPTSTSWPSAPPASLLPLSSQNSTALPLPHGRPSPLCRPLVTPSTFPAARQALYGGRKRSTCCGAAASSPQAMASNDRGHSHGLLGQRHRAAQGAAHLGCAVSDAAWDQGSAVRGRELPRTGRFPEEVPLRIGAMELEDPTKQTWKEAGLALQKAVRRQAATASALLLHGLLGSTLRSNLLHPLFSAGG
ncbi:hypothetical protein L7F22_013303 [Adiantum nelumboides]|nr:hypothetical protein [Adiantum nelumboides]